MVLSQNIEKLDRIYFCTICRTSFLFKSDIEEHKQMYGHSDISVIPFFGEFRGNA